jgi:actin-related protein 6
VPNCITRSKTERRRNFISNQLDECKDLSSLYYLLPFQKGYLINWDTQRQIWDHIFTNLLQITTPDTELIMTEPPFNFASIRESLYEVLFEDYRFTSINITLPSTLTALHQLVNHPDKPCCLVIDSGYSFTHLAPYYNGKVLIESVRRIDVGGKVLTNHLKDIVSYRQLNVMDETYVMNQVKEDVSFVSQDLYTDMEIARKRGPENTIIQEYVLPDYTTVKQGYIREPGSASTANLEEQILRLANERFSVPEVLFHPSDIGINQMGLPEAIVHCISSTPKPLHSHLYQNIVLTGGNMSIPGLYDRLMKDLRMLAPDCYNISVTVGEKPHIVPWLGGQLAAVKQYDHLQKVTQGEYKEHGNNICYKRFHDNQILYNSD